MLTSAYGFRRGAAVLVNAVAEKEAERVGGKWVEKEGGEWVSSEAHTTDFGQLKSVLKSSGFDVVLELGPGSATPELQKPSVGVIRDRMHALASDWQWDADHFDALVVVVAGHGRLDQIQPYPNANGTRPFVELVDDVFSKFQLPVQGGAATRASEMLKGKPKIFIVDACRAAK